MFFWRFINIVNIKVQVLHSLPRSDADNVTHYNYFLHIIELQQVELWSNNYDNAISYALSTPPPPPGFLERQFC